MKKVDTNQIVALAALVTSVVAVFIAWDESRLMRRSQEAAFIPILELESGVDLVVPQIHLRAHNTGHGVAFVESMRFFMDDQPLHGWQMMSSRLLSASLDPVADLSWDNPMGYYPIGEDRTVMSIAFPEEFREELRQHLVYGAAVSFDDFDVEACYCSVFGRCWTKRMSDRDRPQPVKRCRPSENPVDSIWQGYVATRPVQVQND